MNILPNVSVIFVAIAIYLLAGAVESSAQNISTPINPARTQARLARTFAIIAIVLAVLGKVLVH